MRTKGPVCVLLTSIDNNNDLNFKTAEQSPQPTTEFKSHKEYTETIVLCFSTLSFENRTNITF